MSNNPNTQKTMITGMSHDGRGITRINGKTVFVSGALVGEEVRFEYIKKRGKFDEAKVTEIVTSSPNRVTPKCAHFGMCGGCSLQHLSSEEQIALKQQTMLEQLQHFGNLQPEQLLSPLTGSVWGYRRKARLGVKYVIKKGRVLVGFREKNGRFLADIANCEILHPSVGKNILALSELIASLQAYQSIPQIEVAVGDVKTALVFRHMESLSKTDMAKLSQFGEQHNMHIYLQPKGPDSVTLLYPDGPKYLSYNLGNTELQFYPTDFTQVNADINQQLAVRVIELFEPQENDEILDLFCGLGNFTLPLARHCRQIVGVEGSDEMVQRANHNAQHNNITNAEFYCADLTVDSIAASWAQRKYAKILLDPPRTGAMAIVKDLAKFAAQKILYISCNPATLARDADIILQQGYKLKYAGVMDMFPHTSHVEAIALFYI